MSAASGEKGARVFTFQGVPALACGSIPRATLATMWLYIAECGSLHSDRFASFFIFCRPEPWPTKLQQCRED